MSMKDRMKQLYGAKKEASLPLYHKDAHLPEASTLPQQLSLLHKLRINGKLPVIPDVEVKEGSRKWIAICLVIVDELYHEDIWKRWIERKNSDSPYEARLFIHAKFPDRIQSTWVREQTLNHSFLPEWNSPEVVRAIISTLQAAIDFRSDNNEFCSRFVTGTESCIPIRSLDEFGDMLFTQDKSWMNAYNTSTNKWEVANCFQAVDKDIIPIEVVWKALPGWIMMVRQHVAEILALIDHVNKRLESSKKDIVHAFGPGGPRDKVEVGVYAPEEVFFPTMLAVLGYLKSSGNDQVERRNSVYAEWERASNPNPIAFSEFTEQHLDKFRKNGCVTARKFRKNSVDVDRWEEFIFPKLKVGAGNVSIEKNSDNHEDTSSPIVKRRKLES